MISSVIGTFTSWRVIFGVQGGMALIGAVMAFFFVPKRSQLSNVIVEKRKEKNARNILRAFNPSNILRLYKFPSILLAVGTPLASKLRSMGVVDTDFGRTSRVDSSPSTSTAS